MKILLLSLILTLSGCTWFKAEKANANAHFDFKNKGCEVRGKLGDSATKEEIAQTVKINPDCSVEIINHTDPDSYLLAKEKMELDFASEKQ